MSDSKEKEKEKEKEKLVSAVRDWTHFDTLYENHSAQANNAKLMRMKSEQIIIASLKELGMSKSVIRVSGATLSLSLAPSPSLPLNKNQKTEYLKKTLIKT
jgi:hypothetical protein